MSGGELVIIFIVAFLVFGPKRLPELARTLGKLLFELKKAAQDVKVHMETEIDSAEKETKEETKEEKTPEEAPSHEKPADEAEKNK
ncbi:MAG: twin-arginine translocase TatA/TatE family subunit [Thermodesulfovibrionales bacterium]|jgi:Tat protein translocase TatB subunit